ncbi:putative aarF domain-containing protein kinase 2 [Tubulanus polymorphus]|uniref:putative aarF domain-containing protein kinase 2 n=1 Tax=Tubulanus polymorphus TaxID=672921 RepID=UPI003DA6CA87
MSRIFSCCGRNINHISKIHEQLVRIGKNPLFTKKLRNIIRVNNKISNNRISSSLKPVGVSLVFAFPFAAKNKSYYPFRAHCNNVPEYEIPQEVFKQESSIVDVNGESIFYRIWDGIRLTLRAVRILCTFVPLFSVYPISRLSERLTACWWRLLIYCIELSGPTFIKLGQWASTRRDLFSREFCDKMSTLHRRTTPHSWYYTKRKLKKAFGNRWKEILIKFEDKENPVGSGCVAQVYKAYIRPEMIVDEEVADEIQNLMEEELGRPAVHDGIEILGFGRLISKIFPTTTYEMDKYPDDKTAGTGRFKTKNPEVENEAPEQPAETVDVDENEGLVPVAVKVLHPGIYRATVRDLQIMKAIANIAQFLIPKLKWLSLPECVQEFSDLMMKQIDLRCEARNLDRFNELFADVSNVRFPHPIWPFVKCNVLVETWEDGTFISEFVSHEPQTEPTDLQARLAQIGVDILLEMIFVNNFVHGDLHPGNILVQNAENFMSQDQIVLVDVCDTVVVNVQKPVCPLRLVLLDAGITSSLSEKDKDNFSEVFKAVILGQGERVAELFLNHCPHHECDDKEAFIRELNDLIEKARNQTISLGKIQVGHLLSDVFSLMCNHKVKLESNFASIVLAIMVLEGLGRSLDPTLNILQQATPVLLPNLAVN